MWPLWWRRGRLRRQVEAGFAEGFAYLTRGSAHVMLEQAGIGRNWVTAPLDHPLGRGVNFQISVGDLDPILRALGAAGHPLFMCPREARSSRWGPRLG